MTASLRQLLIAFGVLTLMTSTARGQCQVSWLLPVDGLRFAGFGSAIDVVGNRALVGIPFLELDGAVLEIAFDAGGWQRGQRFAVGMGWPQDGFARSVARDGNVAFVGAPWSLGNGMRSGAAFIFRHDGSRWNADATLVPADGREGDRFGHQVAVVGNSALITAPTWSVRNTGTTYVYYDTGSEWVFVQKLAQFGMTVAVSEAVAVVGEPRENDEAGAAYILRRNGPLWIPEQRLIAPDGRSGFRFGAAVAIAGDVVMIGAPGEPGGGAAYAFGFDGSQWGFRQKLEAANGVNVSGFGEVVAVAGDITLIGAPEDTTLGLDAGAAFVFRHSGSAWTEQVKLLADDGVSRDRFGAAVTVADGRVFVGAPNHGFSRSGAVFVFDESPAGWHPTQEWSAADPPTGIEYGTTVAMHLPFAAVGQRNDAPLDPSTVRVYELSYSNWWVFQALQPFDQVVAARFGSAAAMNADYILVGAPGHDLAAVDAGAAYAFRFDGRRWVDHVRLLAPDAAPGDAFGSSAAILGTTALLGAPGDDDNGIDSGSVYVFRGWRIAQELKASDGTPGDRFGTTLALADDVLAIGTPDDDDNGPQSGSVYVFRRNVALWFEEQKLTLPTPAAGDRFGAAVAATPDEVVVGAPGRDAHGAEAGAAFVFRYNGATWTLVQELRGADTAPGDAFGSALAAHERDLVAGAPGDDDHGEESGSVYLFRLEGTHWIEREKLSPANGSAGNRLGASAAMSSSRAIVGAPFNGLSAPDAGSALAFHLMRCPCGDMNCDGTFNGGDIDPFFLALGDPLGYQQAFPLCDPLNGDINGDGKLNGADIDPFFSFPYCP